MTYKPKLSVVEQIDHMKSKGVTFNLVNEKDAEEYLTNNNYFFKIKAYAKMFEKYNSGENKGKYVNLDFGYLKEMSILDMHLRHFILTTCVDIEHAIKVGFMYDFNRSDSDGYEIVEKFFLEYTEVKNKIHYNSNSSYCSDLIDKMEKEQYAIWNLIEVLSFGDFINLYQLFYREYPSVKDHEIFTYPMRSIKSLRNAAAHNNCILNQLTRSNSEALNENRKVVSFVSKIKPIGKTLRINCMKMQVVHDFITMLYVLDKAVTSRGIKGKLIEQLNELVNIRMVRNKDYFVKNNKLKTVYDFIKKVVDNFSVL